MGSTEGYPKEERSFLYIALDVIHRLASHPTVGVPFCWTGERKDLAICLIPDGRSIGFQKTSLIQIASIIVIKPDGDLFIILEIQVLDAQTEIVVAERLIGQRLIGLCVPVGDRGIVTFANMCCGISIAAQRVI